MQSKSYIFIAIVIGIIIIAGSFIFLNKPSNIDVQDNDESIPTVDKPEQVTEPEPEPEPTSVDARSIVRTLVQEYLNDISTQVSQNEKENIEMVVKDYPVELQPASEAVTILAVEGETEIEFTIDVKTKDWAYAVLGIENTLLGGLVDGEEDKLDLGLYCFLQAASLNPDEPEHLSSIAFHLNNKGDYEDAKTLLQYALTIDEYYFPALSNLAYAYAGQGDYTNAILKQMKVVSIRPENRSLLRLADYYEKAGLPEASEAITNTFEGIEEVSTPPPPSTLTLSSNGKSVMAEIEKLESSLDAKSQAILDSIEPRLLEITDRYGDEILDIFDKTLSICAVNFALSDQEGDVCDVCIIPAVHEINSLISSMYPEILPLFQSYESEAFMELEKHTRQAIETVEDADLDESDHKALLNEIHRRFTIGYTKRLMYPRINFKLFLEWYRSIILEPWAVMCTDVSTKIPELKEVNYECEILPALCKKWKVWFIVGSMSYDPETRNFDLSFGQAVSVKYRYNFAHEVSSFGVGAGLTLGKFFQYGIGVYFDLKDGLQSELTADLSPPVPWYAPPDVTTGITISKPKLVAPIN